MSNARELAELGGSYGTGGFVGMKNRIINGAMVIDQRNAGASVTITAASANQYVLDRFYLRAESATGSKVSVQRSTVAPTGFINSQLITSLSAYTIGASEHFGTVQPIEGFNCADFAWGTASAQPVTVSFWVRCSLTGTFGGIVLNNDANRCFVYSYTINTANTWEYKTITIPGDTSGTWLTNNGIGLYLTFSVGAGSSVTGAAGSWSSTFSRSVTGQTSLVGTNGATLYITGVQLEKGSTATSFDYRPYGTELKLCQRYYETSYAIGTAVGTATETNSCMWISNRNPGVPHTQLRYVVPKRATAGVGIYSTAAANTAGVYNVDAATTYTSPSFTRDGTTGGTLHAGTSVSLGQFLQFHYVASAEL